MHTSKEQHNIEESVVKIKFATTIFLNCCYHDNFDKALACDLFYDSETFWSQGLHKKNVYFYKIPACNKISHLYSISSIKYDVLLNNQFIRLDKASKTNCQCY